MYLAVLNKYASFTLLQKFAEIKELEEMYLD